MNTLHLTDSPADIRTAANLLRQGLTVAIPTETVYGLAADAKNADAVAAIFEAKGRPQDNPLIVHIGQREQLAPLVTRVPPTAEKLMDAFWPGPLTLIFPRSDAVAANVSGGLSTLAVRFPVHPVARAIINENGCPLAAPSANRSGSPSPTTAAHVAFDLDGRIAAIVDGGPCEVGVESTVVDVTGEAPRVLRPGRVTAEMIRKVAGAAEVDDAVTQPLREGAVAASPGMKYKHYAPAAHVVLLDGSPTAIAAYVNAHAGDGVWVLCFDGEQGDIRVPTLTYGRRDDDTAQASHVFDALRRADEVGARVLYTSCPARSGVGLAVYNRLLRAAAFEVITLDD